MENQPITTKAPPTDKPFFEEARVFDFDKIDFSFAIITAVLSFLYMRIIFLNSAAGGYFIFTILFFAVLFGYHYAKTKTIPVGCIPYCLLSLASALPLLLYGRIYEYSRINICITMFFAVYAVAVATKSRLKEQMGDYLFNDAINLFIYRPFKNFGCFFKALVSQKKGGTQVKTFLTAIASIVLAIIAMLFAYGTLSQVDHNFGNIMSNFFDIFNFSDTTNLIAVILGIPVSCYLFGIFCSSMHKKNCSRSDLNSLSSKRSTRKPLPSLLPALPMIALGCVYIIFFISHISTLSAAISNGGILYSEYARNGFFELCQVSFVNLLICLLTMLFCKKDNKLPTIILVLNCVLSICTLLLMATAGAKLVLYISIFGLTVKRIYAAWAMVVIFAIFVMLFVRQLKSYNFIKTAVLFISISFIALSTIGAANIALKYNFSLYEADKMTASEFIDASVGNNFAGVPYVLESYENNSTEQVQKDSVRFLYLINRYLNDVYLKGDILSNIGELNLFSIINKNALAPYTDKLEQEYNDQAYYYNRI